MHEAIPGGYGDMHLVMFGQKAASLELIVIPELDTVYLMPPF